jgi:hypothetical protein
MVNTFSRYILISTSTKEYVLEYEGANNPVFHENYALVKILLRDTFVKTESAGRNF